MCKTSALTPTLPVNVLVQAELENYVVLNMKPSFSLTSMTKKRTNSYFQWGRKCWTRFGNGRHFWILLKELLEQVILD